MRLQKYRTNTKANSLKADKVRMVWIEDQTSYKIPYSKNQIQSKVQILFSSMKSERDEKTAEEKLEALRGLRRDAIFLTSQ